jgi:hypothetical protein
VAVPELVVTAVDDGKARRAERDTLGARAGNVPVAGRVGVPHIQPRALRRFRLARQHIWRRRKPVMWNMCMPAEKNSSSAGAV